MAERYRFRGLLTALIFAFRTELNRRELLHVAEFSANVDGGGVFDVLQEWRQFVVIEGMVFGLKLRACAG